MGLKDFQRIVHWEGPGRRPSIGSMLPVVLGAGLLVIFGTTVFAQSRSDGATDLAKYAMKLPEKQLLKIQPKVISLPASDRLQGSGLVDEIGSAVSGRNSLGLGSGEYFWKYGIATTVFWVGEQASVNSPVSNDKSAWDAGWVSSYGGMD